MPSERNGSMEGQNQTSSANQSIQIAPDEDGDFPQGLEQ